MFVTVELHVVTVACRDGDGVGLEGEPDAVRERRRIVVLATRDAELARDLCDGIVVLDRGRLVTDLLADGEADLSHEAYYRIEVKGRLDARRAAYFEGLDVAAAEGTTTISGLVADQAALHGLLAKVRDLGLPLLSVERGGATRAVVTEVGAEILNEGV
jgi:hypothetical protein